MRSLQLVFELILTLQGLDESFLGEVLRVVDAADHTVDLKENAAQMFGDEGFTEPAGLMACQHFAAGVFRSRRSVVVRHYCNSRQRWNSLQ